MARMNQISVGAVRAAFNREWADGIKLSGRIWDLGKHTETQILDVIRAGMAEGKSSVEVASNLDAYLAPERTDWFTVNRRRYMTNAIRTMKPYGRNLPFDSMRLARTEMANAFREANKVVASGQYIATPIFRSSSLLHSWPSWESLALRRPSRR